MVGRKIHKSLRGKIVCKSKNISQDKMSKDWKDVTCLLCWHAKGKS